MKSTLNRHMDSCAGNNDKYTCDTCNTSYASKASLNIHINGMHGNTVHRCEICGKSYKWANSFYRHMQRHK